ASGGNGAARPRGDCARNKLDREGTSRAGCRVGFRLGEWVRARAWSISSHESTWVWFHSPKLSSRQRKLGNPGVSLELNRLRRKSRWCELWDRVKVRR